MAMAKDRLSALHDNLLCSHILSKLPLRDAVRCSILSRRWRSLWTLLPHLKFLNADFTEKIIENILYLHHEDLESLEISVNNPYWKYGNIDLPLHKQLIWKSVLAASVKRVQQITLSLPFRMYVPNSLFSCDCLTFLELTDFDFKLPSDFSGFRYLRTCFLSDVYIIDDMLEQLAAKCPLLENLRVVSSNMGLNTLKISSQSLKYFNFSGNRHKIPLTLTVNCPKLVYVTIHNSMLSLELNSCGDLHFSTTGLNVLEGLSNRNSLRKITLCGWSIHVPSLTVLGRFSNLEELSMESNSFEAASPATGSLTLPLLTNLKKVRIRVSGLDEEEIALIGCLFRNAPSLQIMTLTLPICSEYVHEQSFLNQLLGLNRSFGHATVHITANRGDKCKKCLASSVGVERTSSDDEGTSFSHDEGTSFADDEDSTSSDDE